MASNNYDGQYLSKSGLNTLWDKIKSVFLKTADAGNLVETLDFDDYFEYDTTTDQWDCIAIPPLYNLIYTQHKDVIFDTGDLRLRLVNTYYDETEQIYGYRFSSYYEEYYYWDIYITIPASATQLSSVSLTEENVRSINIDHNHGNIRNDGKSTQYSSDTTKFLRGDGTWVNIPVDEGKELSTYWGNSSVYGVKFCTTTVMDNSSMAYGVFSFSKLQIGQGVSSLTSSNTRPFVGTLQIYHGGNSYISARATILQPDFSGTLNIYYKQNGNSIDWYLITNATTYTRFGFNLMHQHSTGNASITPLSPTPVSDTSDLSGPINDGAVKIPLMAAHLYDIGTTGLPLYVDANGQCQPCTLMGSSSNNILHDMHPTNLVNYSGLEFCTLNYHWVNGGYLTMSTAQEKINGGTVGWKDQFMYVNSSGTFVQSSADVGDKQQPIYLNAGTFTEETGTRTRWIYGDSPRSSSSINLITQSTYKNAPVGAVVIIGNTFSQAIEVTIESGQNPVTITQGRCQVYVKHSNTKWTQNT